jgi:hypothetical protein
MAFHEKLKSALRVWLVLLLSIILYYISMKKNYNGRDSVGSDVLLRRDASVVHLEAETLALRNASQVLRRADGGTYTCKKGKPCKTYACCGSFFGGDEGVCGFGPTFCGDDCDSQCDAKPECGQFADPPGELPMQQ